MYFHVKLSEIIGKSLQKFDPDFGAARQYNSDTLDSLVYMIQDGYYDSNIDTENIIDLLADQDPEDFMDTPSTLHTREYYALKSQSQDYNNPMYMEALSGEYMEG